MALFTLQSWAPSGGAGNMTGLRGGGPLTTLVLPSENARLWEIIWVNVPDGEAVKSNDMEKVFPWMAPTILSGKGGTDVRPTENAHPLQCWWGMPRRIRLDFENVAEGYCDLTGQKDEVLVSGWRQRPYGPKYAGWIGTPYGSGAVIHPLTPRYRQKEGTEWLAVHPQPGVLVIGTGQVLLPRVPIKTGCQQVVLRIGVTSGQEKLVFQKMPVCLRPVLIWTI